MATFKQCVEGQSVKKQIDWKKVIRADLDRRKNLQQSPLNKKLKELIKKIKADTLWNSTQKI